MIDENKNAFESKNLSLGYLFEPIRKLLNVYKQIDLVKDYQGKSDHQDL